MTTHRNQLAYQESVVRNASLGELVITLHDILARDLHAGIGAIEAKDAQTLAAKTKHGFLVLARLEGSVNTDIEGAEKIARFYVMVREQMLKGQVRRDSAILRQLAGFVTDMREAWAEVQGREEGVKPAPESFAQVHHHPGHEVAEAAAASWKA